MIELNCQKLNTKMNVCFAPVLENWQINCLKNYGNTIISKKHLDQKLAVVHYYLCGKKISYSHLKKESNSDKYKECMKTLINDLELLLDKKVSFRFIPSFYGWDADCYVIETKRKGE